MAKEKKLKDEFSQDGRLSALRKQALNQMASLYARFRNLRNLGDKTLAAIYGLDGMFRTATTLNPEFPSDRDKQEHFVVPVPLWALQHLLNAFRDYMQAPSGKTFGEVLEIEGGGQGRRPAKDLLATRVANLTLARMVYWRRAELQAAGKDDEAVLDPNVFADVSVMTGYGVDTVRAAWKQFHKAVERESALQAKNFPK